MATPAKPDDLATTACACGSVIPHDEDPFDESHQALRAAWVRDHLELLHGWLGYCLEQLDRDGFELGFGLDHLAHVAGPILQALAREEAVHPTGPWWVDADVS